MANVTITTADNFIPEYWSSGVLESLRDNIVLANLVDRQYEKFLSPGGDRVNVPNLSGLAASTLTNFTGTLSEASPATEAVTTIVVNTLPYILLPVDNAIRIQSKPDIMALYTDRMGFLVAEQIDSTIAGDNTDGLDSFTQVVGTDNVDLTDDDVLRARQYLDDANGMNSERYMVVSPATLMTFYKEEKYINQLYKNAIGNFDASKGRGYVGRIYDCDVYETTNLESGANGKKNAMFHREAIALIIQKEINVEHRLPANQLATNVIVWGMYGIKKMRNTLGVEMDGK